MWYQGSLVQYLASLKIDVERCSLFFPFLHMWRSYQLVGSLGMADICASDVTGCSDTATNFYRVP